jgi:hypothetical protein
VQNHYLHCSQFSYLMTAVGCSVDNKDSDTAGFDCFTYAAKLTVSDVFKFFCHLHIIYVVLFTVGFLCLLAVFCAEYYIRKNELHILCCVTLCTT